MALILDSVITCPHCGFVRAETMPIDACWFFYTCEGCGQRLTPKPGDCCVFCSYGSVPCPPIQEQRDCCGSPNPQARAMKAMSQALDRLIASCADGSKPVDDCPILAALEEGIEAQ